MADPREVVKAGDIVKVKVIEIDVQRKRIALSMRLNDEPGQERAQRSSAPRQSRPQSTHSQASHSQASHGKTDRTPRRDDAQNNAMGGAFAAAFAKVKR